jgi:hypothetical protein
MAEKIILYKSFGGTLGHDNLYCTTSYKYDDETWEFLGFSSLYDGGKKADKEGHYTFESIKSFIESKGKTKLVSTTKIHS